MSAGLRFGVLGPLEATRDGAPVALGAPRQRIVLALLLAQMPAPVPLGALIDGVWGIAPPESAENALQGYVSALRKVLGRDTIATVGRGYAIQAPDDALDLRRFERGLEAGRGAADAGRAHDAAQALREALELWRGPALADLPEEPAVRLIASRLEDLRLIAIELRVEADLQCGREARLAGELEELVAAHPLRERLRALQMRALYRAGRQADALAAFRRARETLVEELGIEPGAELRELEQAILAQDPALGSATAQPVAPAAAPCVVVGALDAGAVADLGAQVAPLGAGEHELVIVATAPGPEALAEVSRRVRGVRDELEGEGVTARAAAFTSATPGRDLARMSEEQEAALLVVDAPAGLLEDARLLAVLDDAPCDVAIAVGARRVTSGAVLVPFSGAEHDWAAVELGAWLARARGVSLELAGASTGSSGRDASRLLASASLAVQRAFGVAAEPMLVDPSPGALLEATAAAGTVVVGLPERWRSQGLGTTRAALVTRAAAPVLVVRRGLRPGGLTPRDGATRFTWTLAPGA